MPKSRASVPKKTTSARKKSKVLDDDDFEFDDGGIQDDALGTPVSPLYPYPGSRILNSAT